MYCRPFDDQSQSRILNETKAFIKILEVTETKKITIVSSDLLFDEIDEIANPYKSLEVKGFMKVCEILSRRKCINKVMPEEGYGVEVISVVEFVEEKKWE